jgi:hypothetical protein
VSHEAHDDDQSRRPATLAKTAKKLWSRNPNIFASIVGFAAFAIARVV